MEQFVRFELTDKSIRYGVLDLIVQFPTGEDVLVVICSSFSLWFRKNIKQPFSEWSEGFTFPPALQKLTITHEGSTKKVYHQPCIAIKTRSATTYCSTRSYLRRMNSFLSNPSWSIPLRLGNLALSLDRKSVV